MIAVNGSIRGKAGLCLPLTHEGRRVYTIHMVNPKYPNKIPVAVLSLVGVLENLSFTEDELTICDLLLQGLSFANITQITKINEYTLDNITKGAEFRKLIESRRLYAGKAAALTADFVRARLFDWINDKACPEKGELEVVKMAMQAAGLTGAVKQVHNKQVNNFTVTPGNQPGIAVIKPPLAIEADVLPPEDIAEASLIIQAMPEAPNNV